LGRHELLFADVGGFCCARQPAGGERGKAGDRIINPTLYPAYSTNRKMTHDINRPCERQLSRREGYDLLGGLGSPRDMNTIKALIGK